MALKRKSAGQAPGQILELIQIRGGRFESGLTFFYPQRPRQAIISIP